MVIKRSAGLVGALAVFACVLLQMSASGAPPDWESLEAEGKIINDELIVVYRDEAVVGPGRKVGIQRRWESGRTPDAVASLHRNLGSKVISRFRIVPAEVVKLPAGTSLSAAAAAYGAQPDVAAVYPNRRYHATAITPNDPYWPKQWGMELIRAGQAWEDHPVMNTATVVVAVIDSGIHLTHPDLQNILWTNPGEIPGNDLDDDGNGYTNDVCGWDFVQNDNLPQDLNGHGTHVAGTVGAAWSNGVGVAGFGPHIRILPVRGLDAAGFGSSASLGKSIEYVALMNAHVKLSNNSWGGGGPDPFIINMIAFSHTVGQMFVAAAGNDHLDIDKGLSMPGGLTYDNIVSVASVNEHDELSDFSNYGLVNVDIAAPGGTSDPSGGSEIFSTWNAITDIDGTNDFYNAISGTSMASPHVAGAAAYLWGLRPDATYHEIAAALYDGAVFNPALVGRVAGARRLDLPGAIGALAFSPLSPSKFYGDPAAGLPVSEGGLATGTLSSVWAEDVTVDVAFAGDPSPWLVLDTAPLLLSPGASDQIRILVDPMAPGFPTVPGTYSNIVSVTFTPVSGVPVTVNRTIWFRLSNTYFIQSAPFAWNPDATNRLSTAQLTGGAVPLPTNLTFRYYDQIYTKLHVRPNGIVLFESPAIEPALENSTLPENLTAVAGLFPNWMQTSLVGGGVWIGATTFDSRPAFVVTWSNVTHVADSAASFEYQVVLIDSVGGAGSEIRYQYRRVAQDAAATGMGRASTVGLQSDGGFLAAHYTVNGQWRPAPGMEYDSNPGWVDGLPMDLADSQTLRWTWGARVPDTAQPTAVITSAALQIDEISYEIRFNEIVFDVEAADLALVATVPGLSLGNISGGGERFLVEVDSTADQYGTVALQLNANAVYDLAGNWNGGVFASPLRAIPYSFSHADDDFETGQGLWKASSEVGTTDFTAGGWELGTPYSGVPNGPLSAFSGVTCWGTFLGGPGWVSANGYHNGWYPGGSAFAMSTRLDSPRYHVGASATVAFQAFWSLPGASADVLAIPSDTGDPVVLGTIIGGSGGEWRRLRYRLPESLAHRELSIRLQVTTSVYGASGPGLYIDDFKLYSLQDPGIHFLKFVPESVTVPTSPQPLQIVAYNTYTTAVTGVEGVFASSVAGVTVGTGARVPFGSIPIGGMSTSPVVVSVGPGPFYSSRIPVQGNAYVRGFPDQTTYPILQLGSIIPDPATHLVAVTDAYGVRDWLGRPLQGDGGEMSAGYQILCVGPNGVIDPPSSDGTPGGDDCVLYSTGHGFPYERFGAVAVAPDAGLFNRAFSHSLPVGAKLYARAWDGPTYEQSVAYGDSPIRTLSSLQPGTIVNFGSWTVSQPWQYARDLNGDGIPDGYEVTNPAFGLDPRYLPEPGAAPLGVLDVVTCTRAGFRPIRVELFRGLVYILYISDSNLSGAVEVRDLALGNPLQSVTTAGATGPIGAVTGMAIDRLNGMLYVSTETSTGVLTGRKVYRYSIAPAGTLTYVATAAHNRKTTDIAVGPDGGVYIADGQATFKRYGPLFTGAPVELSYSALGYTDKISVFGTTAYRTFNDSAAQVHQIQRLSLPGGTLAATFGLGQTIPPSDGSGFLLGPGKVHEGFAGWLYVADRGNHRLQIFDAATGFVAMIPEGEPSPSSVLGSFDHPTALCVTNNPFGDHLIYVADEKNNRVQRLNVILDADGDGMDDAWEMQHGLDPADPADALLDNDGDGLSNLGEYRLRLDPNDPDTNSDGTGDAFDLYEHPAVPLGIPPAVVTNLVAVVAPDNLSVEITVYFDKAEPLNTPVTIALAGGAYLSATPAIPTGATASYTYLVQPGDSGNVDVTVAGPFQDPPVHVTVAAFTLSATPLPTTLDALTVTPGVAGTAGVVMIGATFSDPVTDAAVTVHSAEGAIIVSGAAMIPLEAPPTTLWSYPQPTTGLPTNRWFLVSAGSTALPGGTSPLQASFAVIDPTIQAFSYPPPAVTWNALTGILYRIEARDSLASGAWATSLATNRVGLPPAAPLTAYPPANPSVSNRFYRVVVP